MVVVACFCFLVTHDGVEAKEVGEDNWQGMKEVGQKSSKQLDQDGIHSRIF